jgi:DNA processing protein
VVVVESGVRGGAMHTVDEALRRDRPVLAVPGPVQSEASAGTNRLLRDVAAPCCDLDDVLLALGLDPAGRGPADTGPGGSATGVPAPAATSRPARSGGPPGFGSPADLRPPPTGVAAAVLNALGWLPATLDSLVSRSGHDLGPTALALAELVVGGWVVADGPWYQRVSGRREVRPR